jgi:hypothetical protein
MSYRIAAAGLLVAAVGLYVAPRGQAEEAVKPARSAPTDLNNLSLEVTVLQTLYQLRATPAQLEILRKLAKETTPKSYTPKELKGSAKLRKTLVSLRDALLKEDEDQVSTLGDKLAELSSEESFEPDEVEITEAAQRHAAEVLRMFSAKQVACYVASDPDQFPDPLELMTDALGKARNLPVQEWRDLRDDVSERVGFLLAGLDEARADKISEDVVDLLIKARGLKDDEFKVQRKELEKAARDIVGEVGPTDVIRNVVERALAELLSNPRLAAALDARLKK